MVRHECAEALGSVGGKEVEEELARCDDKLSCLSLGILSEAPISIGFMIHVFIWRILLLYFKHRAFYSHQVPRTQHSSRPPRELRGRTRHERLQREQGVSIRQRPRRRQGRVKTGVEIGQILV